LLKIILRTVRYITFVTCLVAFASSAQASQENDQGVLLLGVGALVNKNPYEDMENESTLIPFVSYKTETYQIGIDGASYRVSESEKYEISILGELRFDSYDPDELDRFDSIDRDSTIEAGLSVKRKFDNYYLSVKALKDVLDEHDGHFARFDAGVSYGLGRGKLEWSVGAVYRSEDLNLYLFGVAPGEATPTLDAFATDSGWSTVAEVSYLRSISSDSFLRTSLSIESLDSDVRDSPRVNSSTDATLLVVMVWQY